MYLCKCTQAVTRERETKLIKAHKFYKYYILLTDFHFQKTETHLGQAMSYYAFL